MNDTIITSIISVVGVVISVIVSILVNRSQYKIELEKIKKQLEQEYAKSLFEKRLEIYPSLFSLLSSYGKIMLYEKHNVKNLLKLRNEIDDWNNKNSILFSSPTARLSARFRLYLKAILKYKTKSKIKKEDWVAISNILYHFESSLKTEIGVSTIQPVAIKEGIDEIYKFIDDRIN